jgi:drug/metabolite transporter (DMT)-like permease
MLSLSGHTETSRMAGSATSGGKSRFQGYESLVLLAIVGTCLATSSIVGKAAPDYGWHPLALLQWSLLSAAVLMFALQPLARKTAPKDASVAGATAGQKLVYMMTAGVLFCIPYALGFTAAGKVGAGFVALCFAFPLVLTYALTVLMGMDALRVGRVIGVGFGVLGAVFLAISGQTIETGSGLWTAAALSIPVFLAVGNVYRTLKWPRGATSAELSIGMMVFAFLALAVFTALTGVPLLPEPIDGRAWMLFGAQTMIFTLQNGLYFRLQKVAGPVYLSQIGSVGAVVGLVFAYMAFGEVPNLAKIAAVTAIGLGIVFVSRKGKAG